MFTIPTRSMKSLRTQSKMSKPIEELLAPKPEAQPRIYAYSIEDAAPVTATFTPAAASMFPYLNTANPLKIAEDGQQAIDYLAGAGSYSDRMSFPAPDLVFLDLKLPYKSGFEVLEWKRSQSAMDATSIVVLTSSSEDKDVKECYRLGAKSFLVKPPTKAMLSELMLSLDDR